MNGIMSAALAMAPGFALANLHVQTAEHSRGPAGRSEGARSGANVIGEASRQTSVDRTSRTTQNKGNDIG